jgi:DNA polymerase
MDWTIRMFTEPKLMLDKQRLLAHRDAVLKHKQDLLDNLTRTHSPEVFRSNDKFADLLAEYGVVPPTKISPTTGKETYAFAKTDEDFLEILNSDNPDVVGIVEARMGLKTSQAETRALSYANHADFGPWPVDIEYCGALATHRFSGAKGGGGNPQNMQRGSELRKSIHAPNGYNVVVGDSTGIELRIAMTLVNQEDALDIIRSGGDLYCWFASHLYGRKITKKDEAERFLGKLACLSLQYGCGKDKFRKIAGLKGVKLTLEEADQIVRYYRQVFYMVPRFWRICDNAILSMYRGEDMLLPPANIVRLGIDKFYKEFFNTQVPAIHLPGGLTLRYPGLRRDSNEQWVYRTRTHRTEHETKLYGGKVMENISQALAGCVIKEQAISLPPHMRPTLQVHDELVPVVPEESAHEDRDTMERLMSIPPSWWPDLPVAAEVKYHKIYGEAK